MDAPWALTIVGDGPVRGELEQLARALGLPPERARFAGARTHGDVASLWPAVDVLVLPSRTASRWKEQLGHVLLEAMAHGVAVVGSTSGAIPEVIGEAGITFPEGDHAALARVIQGLATDRGRLESLFRAGRERVRTTYTDDVIAARTRDFHSAVLGPA